MEGKAEGRGEACQSSGRHMAEPSSPAPVPRLQPASSRSHASRIPVRQDLREWGLSPRAMIQGLPRAGESHTCSPPAAGATAWNQCLCPPITQPSCPWHPPSVLRSPAWP